MNAHKILKYYCLWDYSQGTVFLFEKREETDVPLTHWRLRTIISEEGFD